jgi:hypothetical protein
MIGFIGRAMGMVQAVGAPAVVVVDTMALGVRQDLGAVGVVHGGIAQVEPIGVHATE